jgi:hypothetical protein
MKPVIFFCACLLHIAISAQQPKKKISFYVQGGYMSSLYVKEANQHRLISEKETRHHKCIILNTGFQFYISEKWRIGPAFTYDHFGTKHRSVEYSNLSYMIRCDRIWKETKKYSLYSGLMTGVRKTRRFEEETEVEHRVTPCYQIYLIGAESKVTNRIFFDVNAGWGVSDWYENGSPFDFFYCFCIVNKLFSLF